MRSVVVYESMYGNTHLIAEAVGAGLRAAGDSEVVPVEKADLALARGADLLVVGGPTHAHGMTRAQTRVAAVAAAEKPGAGLTVDPDAEGPGLRDWLDGTEALGCAVAAFDTRFDLPAAITGRASKGIAKRLRHLGGHLVADPESFFVSRQSHLEPDEEDRARSWGVELAASVSRASRPASTP